MGKYRYNVQMCGYADVQIFEHFRFTKFLKLRKSSSTSHV